MKFILIWIGFLIVVAKADTFQLGLVDNTGFSGIIAGTGDLTQYYLLDVTYNTTIESINIYNDIVGGLLISFRNPLDDTVIYQYFNNTISVNASGFGYTTIYLNTIGEFPPGQYKVTLQATLTLWYGLSVTGFPFVSPIANLTFASLNAYFGLYNWIISGNIPTTTTTTTSTPTTTTTTLPITTTSSSIATTTTTIFSSTSTITTLPATTTTTTFSLIPTTVTNSIITPTTTPTKVLPTTTTTTSTLIITTILIETNTSDVVIIVGDVIVNIPASANITIINVTISTTNDTGIVSDVITIIPENGTQPLEPINITFYNATNITEDTLSSYCLATLVNNTNWTCVDECLQLNGSSVTGQTPHLSSFALFLIPHAIKRDACGKVIDHPYWSWIRKSELILLAIFGGIILLICILYEWWDKFFYILSGEEAMRVKILRRNNPSRKDIEIPNIV